MDTPTVGRIVHYVSYGTPGGEYASQCRAAIITQVGKGDAHKIRNGAGEVVARVFDDDPLIVGLCVMNPTGLFLNPAIPYSEQHKGGSWHWPERVGEISHGI